MSLYDSIYGENSTTNEMFYTTETPAVTYPENSFTNVLGTVFLPRIYAKDLSVLEVGSSGTIAITLTDIHSFDIGNNGSDIEFTAKTNESFSFIPKDSQKTVALGEVSIYSSNNYQQFNTTETKGFQFQDDVSFTGAVAMDGNLNLSGDVGIGGDLSIASNLLVGGNSVFNGWVYRCRETCFFNKCNSKCLCRSS